MKENHNAAGQARARFVTVTKESDGQRVDNFVLRELPGVPKSRIYKMLRKGEVRVNKGRVKPASRLATGDEVRIPPVRISEKSDPLVPQWLKDSLQDAVLYEDKRLVVINKPGGVAVHGGSGLKFGVVEAMRSIQPDWSELSLVHRLDRETSGALVLAKKRAALRELHEAFREQRVSKVYSALVDGYWTHGTTTLDLPLAVHERHGGERHVRVAADGKPSITKVVPNESRREWSLLTLHPQTGRTHQIRVHLAHAGHPIAGDDRYGEPDRNQWYQRDGLPRLFLHAQSLSFDDGAGRERTFSAPLPPDLTEYFEKIVQRPTVTSARRRRR